MRRTHFRIAVLTLAVSSAFAAFGQATPQATNLPKPPPPKLVLAVPYDISGMIPPNADVDVGCTIYDPAIKAPSGQMASVGGGHGTVKVVNGKTKGTTLVAMHQFVGADKKQVGNLEGGKGLVSKCYFVKAVLPDKKVIPFQQIAKNPAQSVIEVSAKLPDPPRQPMLTAPQGLKLVGPAMVPPPAANSLGARVAFAVQVRANGLGREYERAHVSCKVLHADGKVLAGAPGPATVPIGPAFQVTLPLNDAPFKEVVSTGKATYACRVEAVLGALGQPKDVRSLEMLPGAILEAKGAVPGGTAPQGAPVPVALFVNAKDKGGPFKGF